MQESFDNLKITGDNHFTNNEYNLAITFYSQALELEENDKTYLIYLNRCLSYFKLDKFNDALNDAIASSLLKPDNAKTWGRVGSCLLALNRNEDAYVAFDKAFQLDPSNEDYKNLAKKINTKASNATLDINVTSTSETTSASNATSVSNTTSVSNATFASQDENNMEEMITKLKNIKKNMGMNMNNLPIESLMGPLFNKMMSNQKLMSLASDSEFKNQMLEYQNNPLEALKNPKIMDLVGDVLKELDLTKQN
jgi:tetratricopeptide (TPR) repeat protein